MQLILEILWYSIFYQQVDSAAAIVRSIHKQILSGHNGCPYPFFAGDFFGLNEHWKQPLKFQSRHMKENIYYLNKWWLNVS